MGSVKDLIRDESAAGRYYFPAQPSLMGFGGWKVGGKSSFGDLKGLMPQTDITNKGEILAMGNAAYMESAADVGFPTTYRGMLSEEGDIVTVHELVRRGQTSDIIMMDLVNKPESSDPEHVAQYHAAIAQGDLSVYVADAESIFRFGLPLGASSFKKIFGFAGRKDQYETLATYEQTVAGLDEIRADVRRNGLDAFPLLEGYLQELGLTEVPNPGHMLPEVRLNFTTKYDIGGDQDISREETRERMGLDREEHDEWEEFVGDIAEDQRLFARDAGLVNIDGKIEGAMTLNGMVLADFACTPDENRLMILHRLPTGEHVLLPSNKEIQRGIGRADGVYTAIDQAKEAAVAADGNLDNWRSHFHDFMSQGDLEASVRRGEVMLSNALGEVGNRVLGETIWDVEPVKAWADDFLPYASRVQPGQEEFFGI